MAQKADFDSAMMDSSLQEHGATPAEYEVLKLRAKGELDPDFRLARSA